MSLASIQGLNSLTPTQRELMIQFAMADQTFAASGCTDAEARQRRDEAETQLIGMGVYPCYDDEDEAYTYLFG